MNPRPLQSALLANAVFSTVSGLAFVLLSAQLTDLIGVGIPRIYMVIGVGLFGFAAFTARTALHQPV
ncbi:MAG: hypothetical protein AAF125_19100, partial [Chloroflexota bacterium]